MNSFFEVLPILYSYQFSFMVLAGLSLTTLLQSFLSAPFAFVKREQVPGMPLNFDHSKLSFRVLRTYSNSTESLPAFGWALLVAVIAGGTPSLVNWLAGLYFVCRMAFWVIYYSGVGKVAGGPRTMAYVGGLLANIALAITALVAVAGAS
ncbi:MAG: MAPEG family protein [Aliishimia sp.]